MVLNESHNNNSQIDQIFVKMNLLPCDHYEYEFKACSTLKGIFYNYYRGEQPELECKNYQDLFVECLKYKRDPEKNFDSLKKLRLYEDNLVKKRVDSVVNNDVWQLRKKPPSDWDSPLPDWCSERLKNTYWYKASNQNQHQK